MSALLDGAVKRASSRAAVLQGLSDNYNRKVTSESSHYTGSTIISKSSDNKSNSTSQNATENAVRIFREIIHGGDSERTRQFLTENLGGKTILMDNAKGVISATSNSAKLKSKRYRQVSNSKLKRSKLADPFLPPSVDDIYSLHNLWWGYMKAIVAHCKNDIQLQARLGAVDMVGARVRVIESTFASLRNVKGIITAVSKSCFYIVVDPKLNKSITSTATAKSDTREVDSVYTETDEVGFDALGGIAISKREPVSHTSVLRGAEKSEIVLKVVRAVKTECTFAIVLPRMFGSGSDGIINTALYGRGDGDGIDDKVDCDAEDEDEDEGDKYGGEAATYCGSTHTHAASGVSKAIETGAGHIRFDYNEVADGGRVCIIHGQNKIMPFTGGKV